MKKLFIIISWLLFLCLVVFIYISYSNTHYHLNKDIVTYFDDMGKYQLIKVTPKDYFILDVEQNVTIVNFVLYYLEKDNIIYTISKENDNLIIYTKINILKNEITKKDSVLYFEENDKNIFYNTSKMIDLTKQKSDFETWLVKIVPPKYRKW